MFEYDPAMQDLHTLRPIFRYNPKIRDTTQNQERANCIEDIYELFELHYWTQGQKKGGNLNLKYLKMSLDCKDHTMWILKQS